MSPTPCSTLLAAAADEETSRRYQHAHHCLRGVRGVPMGSLARIGNDLAKASHPRLPRDREELDATFGAAWEDGLVAIGLLATCVVASPEEALELGLAWALRTDDPTTADALGWLVLGPAALALDGSPRRVLSALAGHARPDTRRAAASSALAATPIELEGASAAPLRAVLGNDHVRMTDAVVTRYVAEVLTRFLRDAPLHKPLRRVLRVWGEEDAASLSSWAAEQRGGLPALWSTEVKRIRGRS